MIISDLILLSKSIKTVLHVKEAWCYPYHSTKIQNISSVTPSLKGLWATIILKTSCISSVNFEQGWLCLSKIKEVHAAAAGWLETEAAIRRQIPEPPEARRAKSMKSRTCCFHRLVRFSGVSCTSNCTVLRTMLNGRRRQSVNNCYMAIVKKYSPSNVDWFSTIPYSC